MKTYSTAYIFPGQGSQHLGMGKDLFERYPEIEKEADDILGYSIRKLCLEDPDKELVQTQFTQPALYTVNAMTYRAAVAERGIGGDILAGHSLGEYNALHAADVFDFATGLKLVRRRGEIMSKIKGGGMAAVLGMSSSETKDFLTKNGLTTLDVANENSPSQAVISGREEDIKSAMKPFGSIEGCNFIPLRVSGAFHSRYMQDARAEFEDYLRQFEFKAPQRAVLSNVEARPYTEERVQELLSKQITNPVKWCETVQVMLGAGIDQIHEAGPGTVLDKLVISIRQQAPAIAIDWPI
ncbi:ACP S-malonyltransferase [Nisaea nitritireducens]|uniref:ACP S-malonyltransferase n=1 Tax=Nisaea nitritireducens TaxID=568392 RepID=UPI0018688B4E|nr:ACP S-malonyltransferase [Nisaea nitritireducens]